MENFCTTLNQNAELILKVRDISAAIPEGLVADRALQNLKSVLDISQTFKGSEQQALIFQGSLVHNEFVRLVHSADNGGSSQEM